MKPLPPSSVIGILGGGQLGRMTAMAAARLGYRSHIFCPESEAPALQVTPLHTHGEFTDTAALAKFAEAVDVITLEWENLPPETLEFLAKSRPMHPGAHVLRTTQDRIKEKTFAQSCGAGTAKFVAVNSAEELKNALLDFPLPAILKSTRLGYDGKGQARIDSSAEAEKAWQTVNSPACILEAFVPFEREISVIVARGHNGMMASYPAVENRHVNHILAETIAPAPARPEIAAEANALAVNLAEELEVIGLLAIEMFVLAEPDAQGRRVLMNEMAPRPHNSGHWTIDACQCSQFEQLVRAVCGLPLGNTTPHSGAVMRNLLGNDAGAWAEIMADKSSCLHLYGKTEARKGRKMGHVTRLTGKWNTGE